MPRELTRVQNSASTPAARTQNRMESVKKRSQREKLSSRVAIMKTGGGADRGSTREGRLKNEGYGGNTLCSTGLPASGGKTHARQAQAGAQHAGQGAGGRTH